METIEELRAEILRLNRIVTDLTAAVAVLAARDERAQKFIEQIRLLGVPDGD